MSISIKKAGILDTFQDLGRNGNRKFGINPNGAMDQTALRLINILLGNNEYGAVLEMHFPASEIKFEEDTVFAIGGAHFGATLNDKPIDNWQIDFAKKGQILKFTEKILGNRCYLSVKGGFKLEKWLGSSSTNLAAEIGGFEGRKLEKNDKIKFNSKTLNSSQSKLKIARSLIPRYSKSPTVKIIKGAEHNYLTALSGHNFRSNNYKISQNSNRMGFRLEGESLHLLDKIELISSAVDFGTIQLLPDGQMIVLMADHQTTGGYPRIAHIVKTDLPLVAQLSVGDSLSFHQISKQEAEKLNIDFEKDLDFLKVGIKLSKNLK